MNKELEEILQSECPMDEEIEPYKLPFGFMDIGGEVPVAKELITQEVLMRINSSKM